jgi:hypothetical protein
MVPGEGDAMMRLRGGLDWRGSWELERDDAPRREGLGTRRSDCGRMRWLMDGTRLPGEAETGRGGGQGGCACQRG